MGRPRVLLIVGPGGSGKSTLAQGLAERLGWDVIGEDEHWVANGWGAGPRSPEHERIVQTQVAADLLAACRSGRGVVLELILYRVPPNPLTAYQDVLADAGVAFSTIVLKPTVDEVLRRIEQRGRPGEADPARRRRDAQWQIGILERSPVDHAWVVDPTGLTAEETLARCLALVEDGRFDETWAEATIEHLLAAGVGIDPGLSAADLATADVAFGVPLPPELRRLLTAGVPASRRWARWAEGPEVVAADAWTHLEDIFRFDIERCDYWHPRFGDRPPDDGTAVTRALEVVRAAPPLIPIYGHRMLTTTTVGPRPVLSVHVPHDTIRYGGDLAHHLARDHGIPAPPWDEPGPAPVPVWADLFEDVDP